MTVQDTINLLNQVEDKTMTIFVSNSLHGPLYQPLSGVTEEMKLQFNGYNWVPSETDNGKSLVLYPSYNFNEEYLV